MWSSLLIFWLLILPSSALGENFLGSTYWDAVFELGYDPGVENQPAHGGNDGGGSSDGWQRFGDMDLFVLKCRIFKGRFLPMNARPMAGNLTGFSLTDQDLTKLYADFGIRLNPAAPVCDQAKKITSRIKGI